MTYYIVAPPAEAIINVMILMLSGMGFYFLYLTIVDEGLRPLWAVILAFIAMFGWMLINDTYHLVGIVLP